MLISPSIKEPMTMSTESSKKPIFGKFKLLQGVHREGGVTYEKGDIIPSVTNLAKHNTVGAMKFMPADNIVPTVEVESADDDDDYKEMTVAELRSFADEGDIDLEGCGNNKQKIIAKIKASL